MSAIKTKSYNNESINVPHSWLPDAEYSLRASVLLIEQCNSINIKDGPLVFEYYKYVIQVRQMTLTHACLLQIIAADHNMTLLKQVAAPVRV